MLLLIDKPKGMTSHDVVDYVRGVTGERKVGHGGTLDPNATGLLIVGVGRESTKKLGKIAKDTKKIYEAEIFLGEERDTDDVEGTVVDQGFAGQAPEAARVAEVLKGFVGEQMQVPPVYSAIKIKGRKAYDMARKGGQLKLEGRKVSVHKIKMLNYKYPVLKVLFEVSSGTYIRALARDIGRAFGTYAYLKNLRRTVIGKFKIENAIGLDELTTGNWESFGIDKL